MVTGAVGVAAYEALRKMVVKAPLRAATVSAPGSMSMRFGPSRLRRRSPK
ncbi:Protein of uncharacterised function (DUF1490) [Mycobacterium tuberculosis]|nr:Protein of uncharacterised function (DUF1490) [Mycobacterium tuberculosis]